MYLLVGFSLSHPSLPIAPVGQLETFLNYSWVVVYRKKNHSHKEYFVLGTYDEKFLVLG